MFKKKNKQTDLWYANYLNALPIEFRWHESICRQFYSIKKNWKHGKYFAIAWRQWHMQRLAFIDFCCEFVLQYFFLSLLSVFEVCLFFSLVLQLKSSCYNFIKTADLNKKYNNTYPFDLGFNERVNWIYTCKLEWRKKNKLYAISFVWCSFFSFNR